MAAADKDAEAVAEQAAACGETDGVASEAVEEQTADVADATDAAEADDAADAPDAADAETDAADAVKDAADTGDTGDELEAARTEAAQLRDRYARLQAEWDNFRKRTASERASERQRAAEALVGDLLPVLDDIERAIAHATESDAGSSLLGGVEAIQGKFLQILGKHKVEPVPAQGEPFDAMKHQAVGTTEDASVPEETVVQVYQQGYTMGDRVIRPAMVVTSTGGPARQTEGAQE